MSFPAHAIKSGDIINGVVVFDSVRRGFGGYYIPMVDGSRFSVASLNANVSVD